jgi:hypothetical protein
VLLIIAHQYTVFANYTVAGCAAVLYDYKEGSAYKKENPYSTSAYKKENPYIREPLHKVTPT